MKMSKTKMIKDYLIKNKTITSWDAIQFFKETRLSGIIWNLRKNGWDISTEIKYTKDGTPYGIYTLERKPDV